MLIGIKVNGCYHENNKEKHSHFRSAIKYSNSCLAWSPNVAIHTTQGFVKGATPVARGHDFYFTSTVYNFSQQFVSEFEYHTGHID